MVLSFLHINYGGFLFSMMHNKYSVTDLSLNTLLWILTEIEEGNFEEF